MSTASMAVPTLTSLAHGGGCGCKLAPSVLQELLAGQPRTAASRSFLSAPRPGDDAAVWQLDDADLRHRHHRLLHADGGRSARLRADRGDQRDLRRLCDGRAADHGAGGARHADRQAAGGDGAGILAGGAEVCAEAGIPVAGGHSIDAPEPIYGLAVIGLCRPEEVRRNSGARPGDALILTKGIGVGVYSAAIKKQALGRRV